MDELIKRLRECAEFEDKRMLAQMKFLGIPEVYNGSRTGTLLREAADALEAAREDAEMYRWLRAAAKEQLTHWSIFDAAIGRAMKEQA